MKYIMIIMRTKQFMILAAFLSLSVTMAAGKKKTANNKSKGQSEMVAYLFT